MSKYGREGFKSSMPSLRTGRYDHACAGYYKQTINGPIFVLMVAGGMEAELLGESLKVRCDNISGNYYSRQAQAFQFDDTNFASFKLAGILPHPIGNAMQ